MRKIASDVELGLGVRVYDFVNLYGCSIGDHTRVGPFVEIQRGARIGRNCKISSHSFICGGVRLANAVASMPPIMTLSPVSSRRRP